MCDRNFQLINESLSKKFITDITKCIKSYKYCGHSIPALALLTGSCDFLSLYVVLHPIDDLLRNKVFSICVFTGVNVSDHDVLFQLIKQEIKSMAKYPVVFVQSHHDISVKPVIERMVQNFLTNNEDEFKVNTFDSRSTCIILS